MIILLDMDGVLANFEQGFWNMWDREWGWHQECPTPESIGERTTFYIDDQLPDGWKSKGDRMVHGAGFFRSLPPIEGALEGAVTLMDLGHDVFFCTKPVSTPFCLEEKHAWIVQYFGAEFTRKLMIVKDKTLVRADILVDDHPEPAKKGLLNPNWEHVIYDQPYNQGSPGRRITWPEFLDSPSLLLGEHVNA